ncbi:MAG: hypothetical protein DRP78_02810 [Candidatus Omnitrophota bacterium]|nr:MAG: hypothetical protein DRP78_02810 [Candidatus Omnitrophota bacterium]
MFKIISIILIWAFISPVTTFSGKNNLGMPVTQCRTNTLSPHLSLSRESVQSAISEYISAISKSMAQEIPV